MHLGDMDVQSKIVEHMAMPETFRTEGWIYVLSNEYMPNIYKVGMTTVSPENRAKELSSATGVPDKFKIEAAFYSENPAADESDIHECLKEYRINESREFFKGDLKDITHACSEFTLANAKLSVEEMADKFDIICTEKLNELNIEKLFYSLGISILGCKLSAAERLIRFAINNLVKKNRYKSHSLYFHDGKAFLIRSYLDQLHEEHIKNGDWKNSEPVNQVCLYKPEVPF